MKKVHLVNGEGNIVLIRSLMTSLITPFGSSDPVVVLIIMSKDFNGTSTSERGLKTQLGMMELF